jgi:hypothetical protein
VVIPRDTRITLFKAADRLGDLVRFFECAAADPALRLVNIS